MVQYPRRKKTARKASISSARPLNCCVEPTQPRMGSIVTLHAIYFPPCSFTQWIGYRKAWKLKWFIPPCHSVMHADLAAWITGTTVLTLGGEGHYGSSAKGIETAPPFCQGSRLLAQNSYVCLTINPSVSQTAPKDWRHSATGPVT